MTCSVCHEPGYAMRRYDGEFYCLMCFNRLRIIFILNKLIRKEKEGLCQREIKQGHRKAAKGRVMVAEAAGVEPRGKEPGRNLVVKKGLNKEGI